MRRSVLFAACLAAACGGTPAADDIDLPDAKVGGQIGRAHV